MATETANLLAQRLAAIRAKAPEPPLTRVIPNGAELKSRADDPSLDGITMLQSLAAEERRQLAKKCTVLRLEPGAVIADRFSAGTSVFFLASGIARIMHNHGEDGEVTIATVGPGHALGEIAAIDGQGRSASIVAQTDCAVLELPSADFNDLLDNHTGVARNLLSRWAALIRQLDEKVSLLAAGGPEQRVYAELIRLAKTAPGGGDRWLVLEMPSHREIAMWAQTSREVVIRILAELVRDGIVERRGKTLHIHDYDTVRRRASGGEEEPAQEELPAD